MVGSMRSRTAALGVADADADTRGAAIEARMIARRGSAPRIEDYRRSYAACGLAWPGDEEIATSPGGRLG